MTTENRTLAKRWFQEVWNERREGAIQELLHPEIVGHTVGAELRGADAFETFRKDFLAAISDMRIDVEDTVADGDQVVVRWRVLGTHDGGGLGLPATGRAVDQRGMTWMRFADGRIIEGWDCWNLGGLLAELGA
ncbi:MAG: ester cyclase [Acidobacteriota bacterium]